MKTFSLTNLDRITKLDFNKTSNVGAVGGNLSTTKFKNLEVLKAAYNDLANVSFSDTNNVTLKELDISNNLINEMSNINNFTSLTNLETVNLSNNSLSLNAVDTILNALDTNGKTNGIIQLHGTNALPTLGKYNTNALSLLNKGWTVTANGGIDTSFGTSQEYADNSSTANTTDHPDWEGKSHSSQPTNWKNDPTNNRIRCSTSFRNMRTSTPIRAKVGDTVTVSITYDYTSSGSFTNDTDPNPHINQRSFMISLVDMGQFPQSDENIKNHDHVSFIAKFLPFSYQNSTGYVRLFQGNPATGQPDFQIGNSTSIPLAGVEGDKFTLQFSIVIGANAASTVVTASLTNDDNGNSVSGSGTLNTSELAGFYSSLISPTSNVKVNIQTGKLEDLNIDTINVYNLTARLN